MSPAQPNHISHDDKSEQPVKQSRAARREAERNMKKHGSPRGNVKQMMKKT